MPPKARRSTRASTGTGNQSTLSFKNRVSKVTPTSKSDKATKRLSDTAKEELVDIASPQAEPKPVSIEPEVEAEPEAAPPTPRKKKRVSTGTVTNSREAQAEKITDSQIQKWWKQEEHERRAPRVHQSSVPIHEKILRHFDLSGQYGSCIGITRMDRWKRANKLGLEPPVEILAVLLRESEGWAGAAQKSASSSKQTKGKNAGRAQGCGEIAYIDELAGGRIAAVEG